MGLPAQTDISCAKRVKVRRKDLPCVLQYSETIRYLFSVRLSENKDVDNPDMSLNEFVFLNVESEGKLQFPDVTAKVQNYVNSLVCGEGEEEQEGRGSDGTDGYAPRTSSAGGGEDSSYDSDCENEGGVGSAGGGTAFRSCSPGVHDGVSRTASDTLGAEFAEYVTAHASCPPAFSPTSTPAYIDADAGGSSSSYNARIEFGLKLGYSERHVLAALQKLGPNPAQNELLAELIRAQQQQQQSGASSSSRSSSHLEGLVVASHHNPLSSGCPSSSGVIVPSHSPLTASTSTGSASSPNSTSLSSTNNSAACASAASADRSEDVEATQQPKDSVLSYDISPRLRPIVIDGSNVAMSHGTKDVFSCLGIKLCVDWFKARGHKEITVFVPKWRKESSRPSHPITDQEILGELERERLLVFTPSRFVGGKRLVCYDDRYILRLAAELDGIVVSNDNYRDLAQESPEFRKVVEERILMYSFVNDRFMPPDDPLGRSGPTLDNFLSYQPIKRQETPPLCPYGKKCTYGNKCRFHHPERGPLPHKSVTERLLEHAQKQLQEVKARAFSGGEHVKGKSLSLPLQPVSAEPESNASKRTLRKTPLSRTRSTVLNSQANVLSSKDCDSQLSSHSQNSNLGLSNCRLLESCGSENQRMACPPPQNIPPSKEVQSYGSYHSPSPGFNQLHHQTRLHPLHCGQQWGQMVNTEQSSSVWSPTNISFGERIQVADRSSDSDMNVEEVNLHRKLHRQLTLNPNCDPRLFQLQGYLTTREHQPLARHASGEAHFPGVSASPVHQSPHQNVTRIASAPDSFQRWPPVSLTGSNSHSHHLLPQAPLPGHHRMQRLSSTSDPQLNLGGEGEAGTGDPFESGTWFPCTHEPPASIWSPSLQSPLSGIGQPLSHQLYASDDPEDARRRLHYHLSSIFPAEHVRTAMDIYPDETNPQKICAAILSLFPKS